MTLIITFGNGGRRRKLVEKVRTVDLLDNEIIHFRKEHYPGEEITLL